MYAIITRATACRLVYVDTNQYCDLNGGFDHVNGVFHPRLCRAFAAMWLGPSTMSTKTEGRDAVYVNKLNAHFMHKPLKDRSTVYVNLCWEQGTSIRSHH